MTRRDLLVLGLVSTIGFPAMGAGKPSLNIYFQTTLTDQAYQKKAFERVAKTWKTPPAKATPKIGAKTVVQAVISKDGKLVSAFVSMKSGSDAWDKAALEMVRTAAPFDKLPAGYGFSSVEVHFHVSVVG